MTSRLAGALASAFLTIISPVHAEPLVQTVEEHRSDIGEIEKRSGDFVHRASGFAYPAALGEMPARKTVTYGPQDAAVYYTYLGGGNGDPWIDLYVYPATLDSAAERREVEKALVEHFQAKPVESPASLPAAPAGAMDGWYSGIIQGNEYLTGYRIVRSGNWYVKARITIPVAGGEAAMSRAMEAIAAIPWAWRQSQPTAASSASAGLGDAA